MTNDWYLLKPMVVRMTGFPIQLITQLRLPRSTALVGDYMACSQKIDQLRCRLLREEFPSTVAQAHQHPAAHSLLKQFSTWRRDVGRGRPLVLKTVPTTTVPTTTVPTITVPTTTVPTTFAPFYALLKHWNHLLAQQNNLLAQCRSVWQAEFTDKHKKLRHLAVDSLVQEAIFLSSPDMYQACLRYLTKKKQNNSATRQFERRLMAYLQRFCTKNETQSFFGPINYGQLDAAHPANLHLVQSETAVRQRVVFATHWLAQALATAMSEEAEFQPYLKPRRDPNCLLQGNKLRFPATNRTLPLESRALRLFQQANGRHTIIQLATRLNVSIDCLTQTLVTLQKQGALITKLIIPADTGEPLTFLQTWLSTLPSTLPAQAQWQKNLNKIEACLMTFASADLQERVHLLANLEAQFRQINSKMPRRGHGNVYADRLLLFEECLGRLESCVIGDQLAATIQERLQPILRLWQTVGHLRTQQQQKAVRPIWQELAAAKGGEGKVPFLAYLQAVARHQPKIADDPILDQFWAAFKQLVVARSDGHCAHLRSDELPPLPHVSEPDGCDCCSLDLMIAAASLSDLQAGDFQIILGEGHPQPLTWVFPTAAFATTADTSPVATLFAGLLAQPGGRYAAQLAFTRKNKIFPYALPGAVIELRPRYPDCRAIPVSTVTIRQTDANQLRLWAEGQWLRLYPPLQQENSRVDPIAPFAFPAIHPLPVDLGNHTPRIEIDGIVYQREQWRLPTAPLQEWPRRSFELFYQAWQWRAEHDLPDEFFVHITEEPKPVYIDLSNHFLIELLVYLARRSERLQITEMLPNSHQLWLSTEAGHHCCEFRFTALAKGEAAV